ncbi:hypothetical protein PTKIN_Ptkin05aG0027300 [Pterospermum kingtungense]
MGDFNSQISSSSYSIPSEPPDIRNWFSSYKYESFVLDTCENFGGFFSEERESEKAELVKISREKEENFNGSGEIRVADDQHGNLNSKEVQDSLLSPSILSEPTDIRNWFSSYVYQSPLLDTNDGFKSYVSRESECEKDELIIGESIKDDLANSGQFQEIKNSCTQDPSDKTCSTKLIKCGSSLVDRKSESHPLFSEPPDIGNWFPDYVYESPVLDTRDGFRDTLSMETESNEDKFAVGDGNRGQENLRTTTKTRCRNEVVVDKEISNEFGKCNSSQRHDAQENKSIIKDLHRAGGKENISWQADVCSKKILDPSLEVKQVRSGSINSNEGVENSSLNGGDSLCEFGRADSQLLTIRGSPSKRDRNSSTRLIDRKGSMKKSLETEDQTDKFDLASPDQSLDFNQVNRGYQRKPTHGSNDKENEGREDTAENGFITTRKNNLTRANGENSVRGPSNILLQCYRIKGSNNTTTTATDSGKDGVVKRKVLAETTNVNVEQCEAKEITGKWRCPQKSKPPRGPPLKQLRLEQWVHRV